MNWIKIHWLELLAYLAVFVLLVWLIWDYVSGNLGVNPIEQVEIRSGKYTLNFLVATLACAPLYRVSGYAPVLCVRRILGFCTLGLAALHLMAFVGLDYHFQFGFLWADIGSKRFVLIGFSAFVVLLILGVTSTKGWKQRLGRNWKNLQRLIYLAAILAAIHFIWQTKLDFRLPIIYTGVIVVLLLLRLPWIGKATNLEG
jgi:sulfoxide reductase heme-binding subunit YedZ